MQAKKRMMKTMMTEKEESKGKLQVFSKLFSCRRVSKFFFKLNKVTFLHIFLMFFSTPVIDTSLLETKEVVSKKIFLSFQFIRFNSKKHCID